MGATYRFLAIGEEIDATLDWFRSQSEPPEVTDMPYGHLLYFRGMGPLIRMSDGVGIDVTLSPVVSLIRPVRRRGIFWTTGEVRFLPTSLRRSCPPLYALGLRFNQWLSGFDRVFTVDPSWTGEWNHYLEGSIRDHDDPVYALPMAAQALREGQYFVGWSDDEAVLDALGRSLRRRGLVCTRNGESRGTDPG